MDNSLFQRKIGRETEGRGGGGMGLELNNGGNIHLFLCLNKTENNFENTILVKMFKK